MSDTIYYTIYYLFDGASFESDPGRPVPVIFPESVVNMVNNNISRQVLPEGKTFPVETIRSFGMHVYLDLDPRISSDKYRGVETICVGVSRSIPQIGLGLPLETVKQWNRELAGLQGAAQYSRVLIETADPQKAVAVSGRLEDHGLTVESSRSTFESVQRIFSGLQWGVAVFGGLIVLAVGAGLFNGMNLVVFIERDIIGVMRAVGARRGHILEIMLLQAAGTGLMGGLLGSLLAYTAAFSLEGTLLSFIQKQGIVSPDLFTFQTGYFMAGVFLAPLACMVFGLIPALRAVALKPADVLK